MVNDGVIVRDKIARVIGELEDGRCVAEDNHGIQHVERTSGDFPRVTGKWVRRPWWHWSPERYMWKFIGD